MSYQIEFRPEAIDDLEDLDRSIAQRFLKKIEWLAENFDDTIPEALKGELKGLYKLRIGDYRVIYPVEMNKRKVVIHLIGHRREIYR